MIGASSTGTGFRALGIYLVEKDPGRVAWVETRNTLARDPRGACVEMEQEVTLSGSRVKRPMYHLVVSFDPDDRPSDAEVREAVDRTLGDLGLGEHQALVVRHNDTEHEHVHVMVNRVGPGGKAWSTSQERRRLRASMEAQERELGVRWTGRNAERLVAAERAVAERTESPAELQAFYRDAPVAPEAARASARVRQRGFAAEVRASSLGDLKGAASWADLERRLAARGLWVERRGQGAVVTDGEREAKLSSVSRSVSLPRLEARLGRTGERAAVVRGRSPDRPTAKVSARSTRRRSPVARHAERSLRRQGRLRRSRRGARGWSPASRGATSLRGLLRSRALRDGEREADPVERSTRRAARAALSFAARRAAAVGRGLAGLARTRETGRVERAVALVGQARSAGRGGEEMTRARVFRDHVRSATSAATQATARVRDLDSALARLFQDPETARAGALRYAERVGGERAATELARRPARFGALREGLLLADGSEPTAKRTVRDCLRGALGPPPRAGRAPSVEELARDGARCLGRANAARERALKAVQSVGRGRVSPARLGRAVEARRARLRAVAGTLEAPRSRLARAVRGLSARQRARLAVRVGSPGITVVRRALDLARGLGDRGLGR